MKWGKSIIVLFFIAFVAVFCVAGISDAACKDKDKDGYYQQSDCGTARDCNDNDPAINPAATEVCDEVDNNCDGNTDEGFDADGDGYAWCSECDDSDPAINPGATEVCDGIDNNCDGNTDEGLTFDVDGDGYTSVGSCTGSADDCNDNDGAINPGAAEICENGIDENCDGVDDTCTPSCTDNDVDGYGSPGDASCPNGAATDCDDTNNAINPGAVEVCDGVDNNCDTNIDEGLTFDVDGDGHSTPGSCAGTKDDCDDNDGNNYPGNTEVCDGQDNNCDTNIDEGVLNTYYEDTDGDTYGDPAAIVQACEVCLALGCPVTDNTDCDDTNPGINPGAAEICGNGIDENCDSVDDTCPADCTDNDGDSYGEGTDCLGPDCNDNDPAINPGATEVCDGVDNNCDTNIDEGFDADSDGYTTCQNDCNDADSAINPGATEVCDGVDNNCDGNTDEGLTFDVDGDGYTSVGSCAGSADDCDDDNAGINPGAAEICGNGIDENCDSVDDTCPADCTDLDGDGYGTGADCLGPDCDDSNAAINPEAAEICDSIDNNCDTNIDEGFDVDGDGYTICQFDCDDTDPAVNPGAAEICDDGIDNNCNGKIDGADQDACNGCTDIDGDGYGDGPNCTGPDCDDNDAAINPAAAEVCDGVDNNCDAAIDEGFDADGDGYLSCDGDCNDSDPTINPGMTEVPYNGKDDDCIPGTPDDDLDMDGYPLATDCDDTNQYINPAAVEICENGIDENCDGSDDTCNGQCRDDDGDGYGKGKGCVGNQDCDDTNPFINPGAPEICDGIDNNCDGWQSPSDVDADGDGVFACGGDCDDSNATVYPGAPELCDGLDNDCNYSVPLNERDNDGDGYRTCNGTPDCNDNDPDMNPGLQEWCSDGKDNNCDGQVDEAGCICPDADGDGFTAGYCGGTDCDDSNAAVYPGAVEECNDLIDNDCDGLIDIHDPDAVNCPICTDNDGDTFYVEGGGCGAIDCNDNNPGVYPGAAEVCDGEDTDCDGWKPNSDTDADGDGIAQCAGDCNDGDASTYPGAPELCDGLDNDCNYSIPLNEQDNDGDGFRTCDATPDCDDNDPTSYPGAPEVCSDGADNNCDGQTDEPGCVCPDSDGDGHTSAVCGGTDCDDTDPAVYPGAVEECTDSVDNDCDGLIDINDPDAVNCPDCTDNDGDNYYVEGGSCGPVDCNDNNPDVNPGAAEVCDGEDTDCDGWAPDTDVDNDGDGVPQCANDCDDTDDSIYPGAPELCDGIDNDCNYALRSDELDEDGDGFRLCDATPDCNDQDPYVYPGADEWCSDGIDNNCNGVTDEAACICPDADNDGFTASFCGGSDCNDVDATAYPGAVEECNDGVDNDCDGLIDINDPDAVNCPPCTDSDLDGYYVEGGGCGPIDCNDNNPDVYPGAAEVCDGEDTDCDGWKPPTDVDNDGDGAPACDPQECDDNDPARSPLNTEDCVDGIDNDCDYLVDTADPECQFSCTTKTSPRNGPHMFDLLNPIDDSIIKTSCDWCHYDDTGGVDERTECQRCHADPADLSDPLNGVLKQAYPSAPPYGFGTAPNVQVHSSNVVGTQYGNWDMTCLNCHNPHTQEQDLRHGTTYGKLVKDYVCFDNTANGGGNFEEQVQFTANSGPGSFADGPPYTENICNMCHTMTNHHQRDGVIDPPNTGPQDHNNGQNCTQCHAHNAGFGVSGAVVPPPHDGFDCTVCHVTPDTYVPDAAIPNTACMSCHDGTGSTKIVDRHFSDNYTDPTTGALLDTNCVECHNPMSVQTNFRGNTNLVFVRNTIRGSDIAFETYTGDYSFAADASLVPDMTDDNYVCKTCHTQTNHHQSDGTAPGGQSHNDGTDCSGCHAHIDGFIPNVIPPPAPHDTFDCTVCHDPGTYVPDADIANTKCLGCHDGTGSTLVVDTHFSDTYTDPTTGALLNANCVECHNPMSTQSNLKFIRSTVRGSNVVFTAYTGPNSFADGGAPYDGICEVCHTQTNHHQADGVAPGGQSHNDGEDCTTCHGHFEDVICTPPAPGVHDDPDCTVCHVSPDTYVPNADIPNSACLSCHDGTGSTLIADTHFSNNYTDPTTGLLLNANCVECHNPMADFTGGCNSSPPSGNLKNIRSTVRGATVLFTAYTGQNSFADGGAPYDGICEVCHSQTNHHQADGNAPGGQSHNDGADCRACHTHPGGFQDQIDNTNVPPPHDAAACTDCHVTPDSYVVGADIPNTACLSCHDGSSATQVDRHFSDTYTDPTTGSLLDTKCVECHNPMSIQTNYLSGTNLVFIRDVVRGSNVAFEAYSGPRSFADGDATRDGICEVCHTQTNHHQNDGTAPGGQSHNDGSDCRACHAHIDGFQPDIAVPAPHDTQACNTCHTAEPDYAAPIDDTACLSCHDGSSATQVSNHTSDEYTDPTTGSLVSVACVECHNPMSTQSNLSFIRDMIRGSSVVFTALTGANSFADGDATYDGICEVCHTQTNHHQNDGTAPGNQSHNDGTDCTACHTHLGGFEDQENSVNVPAPHNTAACDTCHVDPTTYVPNADIANSACLSCHDGSSATQVDTHFSDTYTDPTTGSLLSANCVECHNPMSAQSNAMFIRDTLRGKPVVFNGTVYDGPQGVCTVCHTQTNHHQNDGTAPGGQSHNDGTDCTACHTHLGGFADQENSVTVPPAHNALACDSCHVDPTTYVPDANIANSACMSCHDISAPGTAGGGSDAKVDTHFSTIYTDPTTGSLLSANCVECHNPMSVQTNFRGNDNLNFIRTTIRGTAIVFEAYTGPYSFADDNNIPPDMQPENYLCNTCHTQTNHHQNDSTAPGGQSHNDGTDCSVCHSHIGGFQDHISNTDVPVPHDLQACDTCHVDPTTYVPDADIADSACLSCHDGSSATEVTNHNSTNYTDPTTGADLNVKCVECHNPMSIQTNYLAGTNMKFIRATVRGADVAFENYTGANSFADGDATYDGICEVCHTQTNHHQNDGTAPGGQGHNDGADCRSCHTHLGSFTDQISNTVVPVPHNGFDCTVCHVTPDTYVPGANILNAWCQACHDISAPGTAGGGSDLKVDRHFSDTYTDPTTGSLMDLDCVECHNPMSTQSNLVFIRDTLRGNPVVFTAYTGTNSFADGVGQLDGVCEVCHTQTNHHQNDGSAPGGQSHNDGTDCRGCHEHIDGFQPSIAVPPPHDVQACNTCHTAEPDYAAPIDNTACLSCHDGSGSTLVVDTHYSTKYNDPTTGALMDLECVECHNPMYPQTNLVFIRDTLRGNPVVFTSYTGNNSFADGDNTYDGVCEVCHTQTNHHQNDGTAPGGQDHNNGVDCTACHEHLAGFIPAGECTGCHSDPNLPTGASYVERDVVNDDFTQASRHVFGGTVTNWDCIVCHREGDANAAASGTVSTTSLHNNGGTPVVDMRDVDSINSGWTWDKNNTSNAMFSDMDNFCMGCHDLDGASGINVNATDDGVNLSNARALTPFNSTDDVSEGIGGGTVNMAGYERLEVVDVATQFNPTNPSHHAVIDQAYQSHNANWGDAAWVNIALKSGQNLTTVYEAANLHCADCHTVDSADGGAHGGANGFMLQATSIDETCFLCHNANVYFDPNRDFRGISRWDHDQEGSVWDPADGSILGTYGVNEGSVCLNCHGGDPAVDGFGGIHGLQPAAEAGADWRSGEERYRFQGGSYMSHSPSSWTGTSGTTATCYFSPTTDTQDWSNCTQHGGEGQETEDGRTSPPNYSRGVPGDY